MANIYLLAQGVGIVALVITLFSYQSKTRDQILNRQLFGSVFFVVHFLMLFAWTGVAMNVVVILRNWVFSLREKYIWAKHWSWIVIFILLSIGVLFFSWEGLISLFPAAGVIIGVFARWQEQPKYIRILMLIGTLAWIPYTVFVHSYPGTITQLATIAAIIYGMYKHDRA